MVYIVPSYLLVRIKNLNLGLMHEPVQHPGLIIWVRLFSVVFMLLKHLEIFVGNPSSMFLEQWVLYQPCYILAASFFSATLGALSPVSFDLLTLELEVRAGGDVLLFCHLVSNLKDLLLMIRSVFDWCHSHLSISNLWNYGMLMNLLMAWDEFVEKEKIESIASRKLRKESFSSDLN